MSSSLNKTLFTARPNGRPTDLCVLHETTTLFCPFSTASGFSLASMPQASYDLFIPKEETLIRIAYPLFLTDCQDYLPHTLQFFNSITTRSPWLLSFLFSRTNFSTFSWTSSSLTSYYSMSPKLFLCVHQ